MAADDEALLVLAAAVLDHRPLVLAPQSRAGWPIRDLLPQFQVLAELRGSWIVDRGQLGYRLPPQQQPLAPGNTWGPFDDPRADRNRQLRRRISRHRQASSIAR